jgi:hypothetical protein
VRWALHDGVPSIPSQRIPFRATTIRFFEVAREFQHLFDFLEDVCAPKRKREVVYLYSIVRKISLYAYPVESGFVTLFPEIRRRLGSQVQKCLETCA